MGKSPVTRLDDLEASSDSDETVLLDAVKDFMDKKRGGGSSVMM